MIKKDLTGLFHAFEQGDLNLSRINYATVVLIPKENETKSLRKFRHISLLNCSFKIFSKALNNRLTMIIHRRIAPNQSAFIKGKFILESVVTTHELIHEIARKKQDGVILKLDYEKAYDRVNWDFLEEMLFTRGFGSKWRGWIKSVVRGSSICVRINDEDSSYFKTGKGLRQGDLLSLLLFNLVADVFTRMLVKSADHGLITGLMSKVFRGGIISLQYADDTLLFLENNLDKAKNFK